MPTASAHTAGDGGVRHSLDDGKGLARYTELGLLAHLHAVQRHFPGTQTVDRPVGTDAKAGRTARYHEERDALGRPRLAAAAGRDDEEVSRGGVVHHGLLS